MSKPEPHGPVGEHFMRHHYGAAKAAPLPPHPPSSSKAIEAYANAYAIAYGRAVAEACAALCDEEVIALSNMHDQKAMLVANLCALKIRKAAKEIGKNRTTSGAAPLI